MFLRSASVYDIERLKSGISSICSSSLSANDSSFSWLSACELVSKVSAVDPLEFGSKNKIDFVVFRKTFNDFPIVLFSEGVDEQKLAFLSSELQQKSGCGDNEGLDGDKSFGLSIELLGDSGATGGCFCDMIGDLLTCEVTSSLGVFDGPFDNFVVSMLISSVFAGFDGYNEENRLGKKALGVSDIRLEDMIDLRFFCSGLGFDGKLLVSFSFALPNDA